MSGTYAEARLDGAYETPSNQANLSTKYQQTNYLDSNGTDNQSLNGDNWSVDLDTTHQAPRGSIGLSTGYAETPIRSGDIDPNAPPESDSGGRYANGTQRSANLGSTLTYNLSPRNIASINVGIGDNTFDIPGDSGFNSGYFDYTYDQASIAMSHYLNEKNYFQLALNGSTFTSNAQSGPASNTTDSFGINGAYSYAISETMTATVTTGISRSSVDITGLPYDPLTGTVCARPNGCIASDETRDFVGSVGLSKRSELTTMNFDVSRKIAPQSNGTVVVQDQVSLYVLRTLTNRLSTSGGAIYNNASAVGDLGRQDQKYFNLNASLSWQLTSTLSTYGKYSYVSTDDGGRSTTEKNTQLFFGVTYRGIGVRR